LNLFRLQQLDTQIERANSRLEEIDRALNDDQRLLHARKKYENAKEEAKQMRIELNQIEDKVEAQRIKRKKSQAALFSGKIKNPKELQDLQMETEAIKRYISQLEDEQLEAMIAYEKAENVEKQAEKSLKQAKGTAAEDNAALLGEQSQLKKELERMTREKDAVLQSIPSQALKLYDQLRKTKRGTAVVAVKDEACGICGQSLTPAEKQSVRASNQLVHCSSCGRILFAG